MVPGVPLPAAPGAACRAAGVAAFAAGAAGLGAGAAAGLAGAGFELPARAHPQARPAVISTFRILVCRSLLNITIPFFFSVTVNYSMTVILPLTRVTFRFLKYRICLVPTVAILSG